MNGASVEHRAGRSIGIERNDETAGVTEPNADSGHALPSNPHESSFGTLQPDGTYCGVFCSENH